MELESIYANNLSDMKLVAKPERDSAKNRYKLIECMLGSCAGSNL